MKNSLDIPMEPRLLLSVFWLTILHFVDVDCIEFFPFGRPAGDTVLTLANDRSSDLISLSPLYPILGAQRTSLRVCIDLSV